jgi:hypothetical protein
MAVVKANYVRKGRGERVTAKANIRYIQERPGRDKEKLTRPLFNNAGVIADFRGLKLTHNCANIPDEIRGSRKPYCEGFFP